METPVTEAMVSKQSYCKICTNQCGVVIDVAGVVGCVTVLVLARTGADFVIFAA